MTTIEEQKYPIGRFDPSIPLAASDRAALIASIAEAPGRLRQAVQGLDDAQLDTPYREGGWTVRQVVHHVPDSHMNAFIRLKWALTEDVPLIKTYDESAWARLPDARLTPVEVSLTLLAQLHERWVVLLRSLDERAYQRELQHPEWGRLSVGTLLRQYEWHGRHHVAHITSLRTRMGWK